MSLRTPRPFLARRQAGILATAFALAFLSIGLMGQQMQPSTLRLLEPHRQASLPVITQTWYRYWDKEYLITYGTYGTDEASPSKPAITLYDRDGHVVLEAVVWFKDAYRIGISDVAVSKSRNLVVAGGMTDNAGVITHFIASIDKNGALDRVIQTTPFIPIYACAAEDGTVWSYGFDRDDQGNAVVGSPILRQYSFEKGQLRAVLDKSTLDSSAWRLMRGRYPGEVNMRCNSQEVGLFNGARSEWIQFNFATNAVRVSKVAPLPATNHLRITGFALTDSGEVVISWHDRLSHSPRSGIFSLTFDSSGAGSWVPVENSVGPYLHGGPGGAVAWNRWKRADLHA